MGTSHRCCTMRKTICKEATAGGRFNSFLDSDNKVLAHRIPKPNFEK